MAPQRRPCAGSGRAGKGEPRAPPPPRASIGAVAGACVAVLVAAALSAHWMGRATGGGGGGGSVAAGGSGASARSTPEGRFAHWGAAMRVAVVSDVGLVRHDAVVGGYAIQAQGAVPANATLLVVPGGSIVDAAALVTRGGGGVLGELLRDAEPHFVASTAALRGEGGSADRKQGQHVALLRAVAWLIHQRSMGDGSRWAPWLREVVPQPAQMLVEFSWEPSVARRCLTKHHQLRWELSIRELATVVNGLRAASNADPRLRDALGIDFDVKESLALVQWAVTAVHSRAWLRPAPHYYTFVPLLDLMDVRASVTAAPAASPHFSAEQHAVQQQAARKRVARLTARGGPNSVLIFGADKDGSAAVAAISPIARGEYVSVMSPTGPITAAQALRRFGFFADELQLADSYIGSATLPPPNAASEASQQQQPPPPPPATCMDEAQLHFNASTGEPSHALRQCLHDHFGGGSSSSGAGVVSTTAARFIVRHARAVLDRIHTVELQRRCAALTEGRRDSPVGAAAEGILALDKWTRRAFERLESYGQALLLRAAAPE